MTGSSLVDAALTSISRRWHAPYGTRRGLQDATPVQLHAALRNPDLRLGADKLLRTHPGRDPKAEHAHEALLVGSLIAHPRDVPTIGGSLPPQRISSPPWRTVYGATLELAELHQPVDLVTVAHATARLSHHGQPTPTMSELAQVVDTARHTSPSQVERLVWTDQVRRIADNGADQLLQGAANPGLQVDDLVDTGRLITTALRDTARMLPEHLGDLCARVDALDRSAQDARPGPVAR